VSSNHAPTLQDLLAYYVDVMNAHGKDSVAATKFRELYAGDGELMQLIATSHVAKEKLDSGELKLRDGDLEAAKR
jgi:hypothetical protein